MSIFINSENKLILFKEGKIDNLIKTAKNLGTIIKNNKAATVGSLVGGSMGGYAGIKVGNKIGDKILLKRAGGSDGKIRNPRMDCLKVGEKGTRNYNRCIAAAYAKKGSGELRKKLDSVEDKVRNYSKDKEMARKKLEEELRKEKNRQRRNELLKRIGRLVAINGALNLGASALGSNSSFLYLDNK